jgi:hypothetical protein
VQVAPYTYSIAPPLETITARLAVSWSIRHRVFSRSGMSRRVSSRSIAACGMALVSSGCSGRRSADAGSVGARVELFAHRARNDAVGARRWFQVAGAA